MKMLPQKWMLSHSITDETRFITFEQIVIYKHIAIPEIEGQSVEVPFEHVHINIIIQLPFVNYDRIRAVLLNKRAISL